MQTESGTDAPASTTILTRKLNDILDQFREDCRHNRDLGDRFERMIQQFLRVDPLYHGLFSEVWMWNEWPLKGQVGDVGIDLVAQHRNTGEYFAIQCKFYLPEHTLKVTELNLDGTTKIAGC